MPHAGRPPSAARFLFVLGGARSGGSTEQLARHAAERLPPDTVRRWVRLSDLPLPAFEDHRGAPADGLPGPVAAGERLLLDATLDATDLVLVTPLYWYSVSAAVKLYLDHWSAWMQREDVAFREGMTGKTLWAVSSLGSRDPADAGPLSGMLRRTAGYLGMTWGGVLLGGGARPGHASPDAGALRAAEDFFAGSCRTSAAVIS